MIAVWRLALPSRGEAACSRARGLFVVLGPASTWRCAGDWRRDRGSVGGRVEAMLARPQTGREMNGRCRVLLDLTYNSTRSRLDCVSNEETFGQRIRALRKARKLDQRSLAERVAARLQEQGRRGFDVTYLSKIENGNVAPPSAAAIMALGEELGADVYELIALAGKVPPGVGEALRVSAGARMLYRTAVDLRLSEQDWQHLLEEARKRKGRGDKGGG